MKKNKIEQILSILEQKDYTLSFAESCSGGMLTSSFIDIPGASNVLIEGLVTYSNESKINRLGVPKHILDQYGAVSEETVSAMLKGLVTDVGGAISGVAGPSGGSVDKPVGTVFIGVRVSDKYSVKKLHFDGDRHEIRKQSCIETINLLLSCLK